MKRKLRWGVLGTANIAVNKVIPAMQRGESSSVVALAGRNLSRTKNWAEKLLIPKYYGSYDDLLEDEDVEAVYIPLPNHLHVPYTIKALKTNKHVLCEKPLALNEREAVTLIKVCEQTGKMVLEAFMVRNHPQWHRTKKLIQDGFLGRVHAVQGVFTYHNVDSSNIRNRPEIGGGGLMDIGCYCVVASRYVFDAEPFRVVALMDRDKQMGIDRLTSCIMDYGDGRHASFMCATQTSFSQGFRVFGERGGVELQKPFKVQTEEEIILVHYKDDMEEVAEVIPACNQYMLQGDMASRVFLREAEPEYSLEDAILNMRVLDAIKRSAQEGLWISL